MVKAGDRVMWMYGNGGPGNVAQSEGTVTSTVGDYVSVQWDCDPPRSPTGYRRQIADKHLRAIG